LPYLRISFTTEANTLATSQASPVRVSPKITGSTPFALNTAAAASSERCAVAMTLFSTRANTGSPGFGVSSAPFPAAA
jgi:hypothetical protein